jgi:hypothetical protein
MVTLVGNEGNIEKLVKDLLYLEHDASGWMTKHSVRKSPSLNRTIFSMFPS